MLENKELKIICCDFFRNIYLRKKSAISFKNSRAFLLHFVADYSAAAPNVCFNHLYASI